MATRQYPHGVTNEMQDGFAVDAELDACHDEDKWRVTDAVVCALSAGGNSPEDRMYSDLKHRWEQVLLNRILDEGGNKDG